MDDKTPKSGPDFLGSGAVFSGNGQGIRFLVESALQSVASSRQKNVPRGHDDWVDHLVGALMSESETSYQAVITSLIASGVTTDEVYELFVPDAARRLGQLWVEDRASFVDVTIGAGRLQSLYRDQAERGEKNWLDRSIPLGQSVLLIIPENEDHSLGAFVAANQFRRHGFWVRMAIGLNLEELVHLVKTGHFAMLGVTAATLKTVPQVTAMIDHLRSNVKKCPPIAVGGLVVSNHDGIASRTGADVAAKTVREAIEKCRLASIGEKLFVNTTE
ncbi:MAG: B12-binding domain-containing protein [Arenibacterium sp.]